MKKELTKKERKIEKRMGSANIKRKNFKEEELSTYVRQGNITQKEADIILEYQKKLPVLQQDNDNWINARDLYKELGVKTKFADWIKGRIDKYEFEELQDFSVSEKKEMLKRGSTTSIEYSLTVTMAKELSMVENNELGRLSRKYFIAIEHASLTRKEWNYDRANSLVCYSRLQQAFMKYHRELLKWLPDWANNNIQRADFLAINNAIIGMTAKKFRNVMGLQDKASIRNAFTEQQLEYVSELENFDADLISIHKIFNWKERNKRIFEKYKSLERE